MEHEIEPKLDLANNESKAAIDEILCDMLLSAILDRKNEKGDPMHEQN